MKKILSPAYSLKLKSIILLLIRGLFFFSNGHIRNFVSTLPNVVNDDFENDNVVLTFSNVVQFKVAERCKFQFWHTQRYFNVALTLCDVATSYQPKSKVEPTLKCLLGRELKSEFIKIFHFANQLTGFYMRRNIGR